MIDWSKPIQTKDGAPARVLSRDFMVSNEPCISVQIDRGHYSLFCTFGIGEDASVGEDALQNVPESNTHQKEKTNMVNWTKPIETVEDGQPARVMGLLSLAMAQSPVKADENGFEPMMVWVEGHNNGGWGNVFLVNNQGFRCDDRALFSARQEPFIRNVKVKKEGWVLMRTSSASMDARYLADDRVYDSEAEAKSVKDNWYGADPGVEPVHLTWEE